MDVSASVSVGGSWEKALREYIKDAEISAKVGILAGATYSGETVPAGTSVAAVAVMHEFGGEGVPARSFMRSTVAKKNTEWVKLAVAYLKANPAKLRQAFMLVGEVASKDMQETIERGITPALSQRTIEYKIKRGKKRPNTPLIDTGTLQESISYEVE